MIGAVLKRNYKTILSKQCNHKLKAKCADQSLLNKSATSEYFTTYFMNFRHKVKSKLWQRLNAAKVLTSQYVIKSPSLRKTNPNNKTKS